MQHPGLHSANSDAASFFQMLPVFSHNSLGDCPMHVPSLLSKQVPSLHCAVYSRLVGKHGVLQLSLHIFAGYSWQKLPCLLSRHVQKEPSGGFSCAETILLPIQSN